MNLKCKAILNINVVNFLIIHITMDFSKNHIKNYGYLLKKWMNSLWTFEMMILHLSHIETEKCKLKKYVIVMSKYKYFFNTKHCRLIFLKYHNFIFYCFFSMHIEISKLSNGLFNKSHV
jgi:hypothetical protein